MATQALMQDIEKAIEANRAKGVRRRTGLVSAFALAAAVARIVDHLRCADCMKLRTVRVLDSGATETVTLDTHCACTPDSPARHLCPSLETCVRHGEPEPCTACAAVEHERDAEEAGRYFGRDVQDDPELAF